MVLDHTSVWDNCMQLIKKNINVQSYKTWFEPIKPVRLDNDALTIQVPNKFFYEWLEENFLPLLRMAVKNELGDNGRLEYQIMMAPANATAQNRPTVGGQSKAGKTSYDSIPSPALSAEQIKNPFVIPGIKKTKFDPQLNPKYTISTFIEGDCNRLARAAGHAVANKPGGTAFNPLFIYGNVGLGKTHLAQAIGNDIVAKHEDKSVLYVTAEKFTNQIIEAIMKGAISDLVNFYQSLDVLIVDDIQFLANKVKTQEIFFHVYNQLHQTGRQLIMTSDRAPKDLEGIEERLISRFKWGLSADLSIPDYETRRAILESKLSMQSVEVPENVCEFICYNIKNNIRELEGVFVSLIAQSSLNQKEIDLDLAREVIAKFVSQLNKEITVDFIQKIVAERFDVPVEKLHQKTRKHSVVIARQLSMYLAKNLTTKSLKGIGEIFGGRDHSTVIYSCKAIQDMMDIDLVFKDTVQDIEKKIRLSLHES